jgi:hypothetical protein
MTAISAVVDPKGKATPYSSKGTIAARDRPLSMGWTICGARNSTQFPL